MSAHDSQSADPLVSVRFEGADLPVKDKNHFSRKAPSADPYVILYGVEPGDKGKKHKLAKTEVIKHELNPSFEKVVLGKEALSQLPSLDLIRAEVWDWDMVTKDDLIGKAELPELLGWLRLAESHEYNPHPEYTGKKAKELPLSPVTLLNKHGKPAGTLKVRVQLANVVASKLASQPSSGDVLTPPK